jgi:hypothetical protein
MKNHNELSLFMIAILAGIAIASLGGKTAPHNRLGWFILIAGLSSSLIGFLFLVFAQYRQRIKLATIDRSLWLIVPGFLAISLIPPLEFLLLPATLPRTALMEEIGLLLLGAGLLFYLRYRYVHELWDIGGVLVSSDPHLSTTGKRRLTCYVEYIGLALLSLGICIGYSSLIGLCAILLVLLPVLIYRITRENRSQSTIFTPFTSHKVF